MKPGTLFHLSVYSLLQLVILPKKKKKPFSDRSFKSVLLTCANTLIIKTLPRPWHPSHRCPSESSPTFPCLHLPPASFLSTLVLNQVNNASPTYNVIETGTVGLTPLNIFLPSVSYPCNSKVVLLKYVNRQDSVDCHKTGCVTGCLWLRDPSPTPSHISQDICLLQEANGALQDLTPTLRFFPETPHILQTLFLSSLTDVGSIYGDTL